MELENHHLWNTIVITITKDSNTSKVKVWWEIKYLQRFMVSLPYKVLSNYEEKNNNFIVEKWGRYHLNQVIKVNITSDRLSCAS